MGSAMCRVPNCSEKGGIHFHVHTAELTKNKLYLYIPEMWEHYIINHKFQVQKYHRNLIMGIKLNDPTLSCERIVTRSSEKPVEVRVLCVERTEGGGYDHATGGIDYVFINHLKAILAISKSNKTGSLFDTKPLVRRVRP